jgi:hypothetical protein
MAPASPFHPYKVINKGRTSLQLKPRTNQKLLARIMLAIPLLTFLLGIILYFFSKEIVVLFITTGGAALEVLAFSFVKSLLLFLWTAWDLRLILFH